MRQLRLAACLAMVGIALVLLLARPHTAQETTGGQKSPAGQKSSGKPLDVSYVTDDFFAAVVVHPARLWKSPGLKELPLDAAATAIKEYVGLDPRQVEQVMLLVPRPNERFGRDIKRRIGEERPAMPIPLGSVIRLNEPVANKALLERVIKTLGWSEPEAAERAGKAYWKSAKNHEEVAIYLADERTIVLGGEPLLGAMIVNLAPGGKLAGLLRKADASADVLAVVDPSPLRELLASERRFADDAENLVLGVAAQILRRIESYSFSADFSAGSRLRWEIAATSEADAELLYDLIRGWQAALKLALPAILEQLDTGEEGGMEAEIQKLVGRIAADVLTGITTSRKEDRVVLELEMKGSYAELMATAAKSVAAAREETPIMESTNNLRLLGLALHNYHDTHRGFPPHAIYEADEARMVKKDGKPLLSWRVAILPFIEYKSLYDMFRHDEPWDSPHNKKLIAAMPLYYKSPGLELGEGKTCYVLPMINEGTYTTIIPQKPGSRVWQGPTTLGSIVDGTSNTLMVVEVAPEKAVIWTKPDDWEVDVKKPKEGLFGARKGFALAVRGDASALRVSEKVSPETLLQALGRADGQQYDADELGTSASRTRRRVPFQSDSIKKTEVFPRSGIKTPATPYQYEKTKTLILPRPEKTGPRRDFKTDVGEPRKTS